MKGHMNIITKEAMMEKLLAACPSFEPQWSEFLAEWQDEPDEPPIYVALADFARHLCAMLERGETESFPGIFSAIEDLHLRGDAFVKQAATIGILESLLGTPVTEQFVPYFEPETARWWLKLNRFWNGDLTALRG
jgi:hypothetical protein